MEMEAPGLPLPLSGETKVYVIIGDPIAQVGSPRVFNSEFRQLGVKAVLVPLHVSASGLTPLLAGLRHMRNLGGIVVTVPHKFAVMEHVDEVGVSGRRIGAVNAIKCRSDGTWSGENFDGKGCILGLRQDGHDVQDRQALIIGAGGAGSSVAHAMADAGVSRVRVSDLDPDRQTQLCASLRTAHPHLDVDAGPNEPKGFDVVVNCTPLGMRDDDPFPVKVDALSPDTLVIDVILKPLRSPLLEAAAARGCATQPGHRMLEGQARAVLDFFMESD